MQIYSLCLGILGFVLLLLLTTSSYNYKNYRAKSFVKNKSFRKFKGNARYRAIMKSRVQTARFLPWLGILLLLTLLLSLSHKIYLSTKAFHLKPKAAGIAKIIIKVAKTPKITQQYVVLVIPRKRMYPSPQYPGGYKSGKDKNLEITAKREAFEETKINLKNAKGKLISSTKNKNGTYLETYEFVIECKTMQDFNNLVKNSKGDFFELRRHKVYGNPEHFLRSIYFSNNNRVAFVPLSLESQFKNYYRAQ